MASLALVTTAVECRNQKSPGPQGPNVVRVDEALEDLAEMDPDQARVVELRFFGGLTVEETAEFLEISSFTVKRERATAKAWLHREMTSA